MLVALVCARLGVWQVGRLHQRRALNAKIAVARGAPVLIIDANNNRDSSALAHRRVRARGHFDSEHEQVVRGAVEDGTPGVHVITPLLLDGDTAGVLVDRGFVPSPDAGTVRLDSLRELGAVEVSGLAMPFHGSRQSGEEMLRGGNRTWRRLNLTQLRARIPYPLAPVYILQAPDSALPPVPHRGEPSPLDDGPHLNYALQWFLFAGMALVFAGIALWQGRR